MSKIIGVQFKENGKIYYFDDDGLDICVEDKVIVDTETGLELATVSNIKKIDEVNRDVSKIVRKASEEDERKLQKNKKDAKKAIEKAVQIAHSLELSMKFVDATYTFDRNKLIFYFISEGRVDFRELAKQLAAIYKTRIELRQIGVRDKAKEVSGIGACGRQLCCSCFLKDMDSVTISMAKNQNIVLNPSKINGLCGRLLCCLNYEDELYAENRIGMPELGEIINTEHGDGQVIFIDIPNRKVIVNVLDYGKVEVKLKSKCDACGKCNK